MTRTDKSNLVLTLRQDENDLYIIAELSRNFQTTKILRVFDKKDTRESALKELDRIAQFYHGDGQFDHGYSGVLIERDLHPPDLPCTNLVCKTQNTKPIKKHHIFGFAF